MAVRSITTPLSRDVISSLEAGDAVLVTGRIVTGRDRVHAYLCRGGDSPVDLRGMVIYHCGPVGVRADDGTMRITAAGPTTSFREEPYQASIIERFGIGAVMGKGGMGEKTRRAMKEFGCVYLHVVGGAARFLAGCIDTVEAVHFEEFGSPEAMWVLQVRDMPALVTMDARGESLHERVLESSSRALKNVLSARFIPRELLDTHR